MLDPEHSPLQIAFWPEPMLSREACRVESFDGALRSLVERMIRVMYEADGVGLAAPQVGESIRLFVADPREGEAPNPIAFINPELELQGEMVGEEEGCLSIPGVQVCVRRPVEASITAQDLDGNPFTLSNAGLAARVWQHETDHLNGILIIDRMSPLDRLATRKTLKELRADAEAFDFDR